MTINRVMEIGRLTRDPEMRETSNGKQFASFSIAVQGWSKDTVNFFNCVAWNKTAEIICKYLSKGAKIGIEGTLESYAYKDKQGNNKSGVQINVQQIEFMSAKGEGGEVPQPHSAKDDMVGDDDDPFGDDLPF